MITLHAIVKNEDKFVKAALVSALESDDVERALVWDTGSTDKTVAEILSIKDPRIEFMEKGNANRKQLASLRNQQLKMTKTPWILLVDGDEVWPEKNLQNLIQAMKHCGSATIALVCRTRNSAGDIYHYLPESRGHYQIGPWSGHLNIRVIRNLAGLVVKGEYPNEWYELDGKKIQDMPDKLKFVGTWYLHTTHLKRSKSWLSEAMTIDRLKKHKWFYRLTGTKLIEMDKSELPAVLQKS